MASIAIALLPLKWCVAANSRKMLLKSSPIASAVRGNSCRVCDILFRMSVSLLCSRSLALSVNEPQSIGAVLDSVRTRAISTWICRNESSSCAIVDLGCLTIASYWQHDFSHLRKLEQQFRKRREMLVTLQNRSLHVRELNHFLKQLPNLWVR